MTLKLKNSISDNYSESNKSDFRLTTYSFPVNEYNASLSFHKNEKNQSTFAPTFISPTTYLPANEAVEATVLCVKVLVFSTIIIGAVLGNALVIISVQKNRKLR